MKEEIFEINGIKYKRSKDPLKDGDEVYCIARKAKIPYGTKGNISSIQYDRVKYNGLEFVIWANETAKLEPIKQPNQ